MLIPDSNEMRARWERLRLWEEKFLAVRNPEFEHAREWLSAARELAAQLDPDWGSLRHAEAHWRHLTWTQQTLARVRFSR